MSKLCYYLLKQYVCLLTGCFIFQLQPRLNIYGSILAIAILVITRKYEIELARAGYSSPYGIEIA